MRRFAGWGLVATAALVAGCIEGGGGADGAGGAAGSDAGVDGGGGGDVCAAGCAALEACGLCQPDDDGACLSTEACAARCRADGDEAVAACLARLEGCDEAAVDACYDHGSEAGAACRRACEAADRCGWCIPWGAGKTCEDPTDVEGCVARCLAHPDPTLVGCLPEAERLACDAAGAGCFAEAGDCAAGCEALEWCGFCLPDESGECLSPDACVAGCRERDGQAILGCVAAVAACDPDAIDACFAGEDPGDDACGRGCAALDDCGLCLPDEGDGCLGVVECAASCRERGEDAILACVADVEACDEGAIDACFAGGDPGDDACARGCLALDGCGLCLPGEGDECLSVVECAEACRTAGDDAAAECVARLDVCDEAAIGACYEDTPSCELHCQRTLECEGVPDGEEPAAALARCVAACREETPAEVRRCTVEAETCEAAVGCLEPDPRADCEKACERLLDCAGADADDQANLAACTEACVADVDADQRACVLDAPDCRQVAECGGLGAELPVCLAACRRRVECAAVPPDDRGAALAACLGPCDVEDPARRRCAAEAESCEALAACDAAPPEGPDCAETCERLAECDPEAREDPEARAAFVAECVDRCEDEARPDRRRCVADAETCEAVAACVPDGGAAEPSCEQSCDRAVQCFGGDDPEAYRRDCVAECPTESTPRERRCVVEAETCDQIIPCIEGVPVQDEEEPTCAETCERLEACAPEPPDAEERAACVADCRDGLPLDIRRCMVAAPSCDAIRQCLPDERDEDVALCEPICRRFVDECGDVPEESRELVYEQCVQGCALESTPEQRECAAAAETCEALEACGPAGP